MSSRMRLLGLGDGGGIFELAALQVEEREAAQSYRIRRGFLPSARGHRAALDHVEYSRSATIGACVPASRASSSA